MRQKLGVAKHIYLSLTCQSVLRCMPPVLDMATEIPVKILDSCRVKPPLDSPKSSLPLTYFDTFWLKFHPVERIFFYQLTDLTRSLFDSVVLPRLKSSLSLALLHFLPLSAGKIRWPPHLHKPIILYNPNDTVLLTIAESSSDFTRISGNQKVEASESHFYVPDLLSSDSEAETLAFQITLFPNQGFCIGISSHHAVFDGKSIIMFIKAWAYLCKHSKTEKINPTLPPQLTPFLDPRIIQNPEELDMFYLNSWFESNISEPRSLKIMQFGRDLSKSVRSTFEFSQEDINKLRPKVITQLDEDKIKSMHLSKFVLSLAYTLVSIVKAKRLEPKAKIGFGFVADTRARLNPPVPENYFGNCCKIYSIYENIEALLEDNGVTIVVEKLSEKIKGLERSDEGEKKSVFDFFKEMEDMGAADGVGIAGSPKFEVYGTDFGWGKPKKVEITSIDKGVTISMAERKSDSGGIEIGLVLNVDEMELFNSLFVCGLNSIRNV